MTYLETRDLRVRRGTSAVLNFGDLYIRQGEKTLILGPSGCGKTTFLSILAGLLPPDRGQVLLAGEDFYALPPRHRDRLRGRHSGFVFQTLHLLPSLTLRQNIALAADMAGLAVDKDRLDRLLGTLGLADKADRKPESMSQGEQQRAAIARAVLNRPRVIMADEPTSALDDANAAIVAELLASQAAETGAALVVATHDSRIIPHFNDIIRLGNRTQEAA